MWPCDHCYGSKCNKKKLGNWKKKHYTHTKSWHSFLDTSYFFQTWWYTTMANDIFNYGIFISRQMKKRCSNAHCISFREFVQNILKCIFISTAWQFFEFGFNITIWNIFYVSIINWTLPTSSLLCPNMAKMLFHAQKGLRCLPTWPLILKNRCPPTLNLIFLTPLAHNFCLFSMYSEHL